MAVTPKTSASLLLLLVCCLRAHAAAPKQDQPGDEDQSAQQMALGRITSPELKFGFNDWLPRAAGPKKSAKAPAADPPKQAGPGSASTPMRVPTLGQVTGRLGLPLDDLQSTKLHYVFDQSGGTLPGAAAIGCVRGIIDPSHFVGASGPARTGNAAAAATGAEPRPSSFWRGCGDDAGGGPPRAAATAGK